MGWNDRLDDPNAYVEFIDQRLAQGDTLRKDAKEQPKTDDDNATT